jgi:hypothetical protein
MVMECKDSLPFTAIHHHLHSQPQAPILSQINSAHILFFKNTNCTASICIQSSLEISATCKSIYALPGTLNAEDKDHTFQDQVSTVVLFYYIKLDN